MINQGYCQSHEMHLQRVRDEHHRESEEMARANQAERSNIYEKLSQAEQVLEQITEELSLLSQENKFLSKLNQRLTYHACRQEKYFMDWRKQSQLNGSHISQSYDRASSYCGSQSNISTQEVVLKGPKELSKDRVTQVISEAETILKSSDRLPAKRASQRLRNSQRMDQS